jgi:hypothetical protein
MPLQSVLAVTSPLCRMFSLSVNETRQVCAVDTRTLQLHSE